MPRVHYRKAAKDYPAQGIEKGEMYYYTKLKLQRGGIVKRSKTPFKPSQLTNSAFRSTFLSIGESFAESDKGADAMNEAAEALRELGSETRDAYENMPEGLQQGDTGQMLETRADGCEEKADEIEACASEIEDEPEEVAEPEHEEVDAEDNDGWDEFHQYESDKADWDQLCEEKASEVEDILSDMPEY